MKNQGTVDPRTKDVQNEAKNEPCRCKEASTMTPRELIKLMIDDLTFWKKPGKDG